MKLTLTQEFDNVAEAVAWLRRHDGGGDAPETPMPPKRRLRAGKPNVESGGPQPAPAPAENKAPELADVQAAIEAVFGAKGINTARDLLSRFGVQKVSGLKSEQYAKFVEEAKRVAAGEDPAAAR